jgi:hypothetical protein
MLPIPCFLSNSFLLPWVGVPGRGLSFLMARSRQGLLLFLLSRSHSLVHLQPSVNLARKDFPLHDFLSPVTVRCSPAVVRESALVCPAREFRFQLCRCVLCRGRASVQLGAGSGCPSQSPVPSCFSFCAQFPRLLLGQGLFPVPVN